MQKNIIKSCCGKSAILYISSKPICRNHVILFEKAGFIVPANYVKKGMFYAQKQGFIATASFDMTKINVRCSGNGCANLTQEFENIIAEIEK